ncbi:unnamed protein product [Prunus brigantina]
MDKAFNDVAQGNTRFSIVATELMKATEDTRVRDRLAAWSPGGRLGVVKTSNLGLGVKGSGAQSLILGGLLPLDWWWLPCLPRLLLLKVCWDRVRLMVQETVPAILVDLHQFMGPILRWGDVKEQQLSCLWVKRAFTLAEPRLDRGAIGSPGPDSSPSCASACGSHVPA